MAKAHISRKELIKEHALEEAGMSITEYVQEHGHQILTGLLAAVALFLLVFAVVKYNRYQAQKAADLLSAAQKQYLTALSTTEETARVSLLDDAISSCESLVKAYGAGETGREALFIKGNCQYMKDAFDDALATFETFEKQASDKADKAKALIAEGVCHEDKAFIQNNDKALLGKAKEAYAKAQELAVQPGGKPSFQKYQAMLGLVRVNIALGELAEAKKLAETVKTERAAKEGDKEKKVAQKDFENWQRMSRSEKSRLIRKSLTDARNNLNFEKRAEMELEVIEARMKAPAAAAMPLPVMEKTTAATTATLPLKAKP